MYTSSMKIIPVDCNYVETEFAMSYLLLDSERKRAFFIECNTNYAIPYLIQAVEREGLSRDDVEGLIITHVHLDHAGGAGLFLKEFPKAKLYAHPRAARHAIDPSKLIASATQVYGEEFMKKLYGEILPCPAERVVVLEDGASVEWSGGWLETRHTRGHANHHLCVIEPQTKTLFSGDSFGVAYPKVREKHGLVILVSTSPTDFDGAEALKTIEWIQSVHPRRVALTHFGFVEEKEIGEAARQLKDQLRFSMELVDEIRRSDASAPMSVEAVRDRLRDETVAYYARKGIDLDAEDLKHLSIDLDVNAQGLVFAAHAHR